MTAVAAAGRADATAEPIEAPVRRGRRVRLPLFATALLVLGGAGLPGPALAVEVVTPAAIYAFRCPLHTQGVAGPGVGVLTLITQPTPTR